MCDKEFYETDEQEILHAHFPFSLKVRIILDHCCQKPKYGEALGWSIKHVIKIKVFSVEIGEIFCGRISSQTRYRVIVSREE